MHEQRGTSALIAIGFISVLFLIIYIAYSFFSPVVTTPLSALENADTNDVVPDHIFDNNQTMWEVWAVVLVIILFVVAIAYIYRHEREHAYSPGGMFS